MKTILLTICGILLFSMQANAEKWYKYTLCRYGDCITVYISVSNFCDYVSPNISCVKLQGIVQGTGTGADQIKTKTQYIKNLQRIEVVINKEIYSFKVGDKVYFTIDSKKSPLAKQLAEQIGFAKENKADKVTYE